MSQLQDLLSKARLSTPEVRSLRDQLIKMSDECGASNESMAMGDHAEGKNTNDLYDMMTRLDTKFNDLETYTKNGFKDLTTDMKNGFKDLNYSFDALNLSVDGLIDVSARMAKDVKELKDSTQQGVNEGI